jgi:hypothetical protein
MRHHQALFEKLQKYTGMYVLSETYGEVVAFVMGYDTACEGGVLIGFREWLAVRLGKGSNLSWPPLVLMATFPDADLPEEVVKNGARERRLAIDTLFMLVREFDTVVAEQDGLSNVLLAYREKFEAWGAK